MESPGAIDLQVGLGAGHACLRVPIVSSCLLTDDAESAADKVRGTVPTSFPGFDSPAIGFEAPFDMPEACHGRMRRSLGLPNRLVACVDEHGLAAMSIDVQRRRLVTTPSV